MPTITIMAPGWEEKIEVATLPFLLGAASDIADDVRNNLRQAGNVKTGALLRSVRSRRTQVIVGTDHWAFIEFGTKPHAISPGQKGVLANRAEGFGPVFHTVRHPGNRAYAPIRRAAYKKRRLRRGV